MFTSLEKKILTVLAFVQFNHIVDFMIIMPMGTQLMRLFSIEAQQFSLLVSSYTFFAGVSGFLASFYMDRFDRKKSLLVLFTGFTLATIFCGLARDYHTLLIARSMTGFFGGVMNSIILSITSDLIDYKRRGMAMGFLATAFSAASILGVPFSIFLSQSLSWYAPFIFLAILCLVILVGIYHYVPSISSHLKVEPEMKHVPKVPFWQPAISVLQSPVQRMSLIFMFFVMFSHFSIIPFIATSQVVNAGLSESQLTLIYLIGGICSFFSAPMVGRFSDRYGKAKIYMYSILFSIVPIFLVTHQGKDSLWVVLLVAGLFFISAGSRMIPAQALVSGAVSSQQRGAFMSLLSCLQSMAMAAGAYIAGLMVTIDPVDGRLLNYPAVGYMAIGTGLFTLVILQKLKYLDQPTATDEEAMIEAEVQGQI
ncbi:MFS transporter [Bdellovibrio sp. qaytius]|nr:MFS transporter [Bdellovibrio sp. qaytius]